MWELLDQISQWAIFVFGPSAIFVVGMKKKWRRWGYVLGMISQPFWFYTLIYNKQWPIVAVSFLYTISWGNGIWNHWIKKGE